MKRSDHLAVLRLVLTGLLILTILSIIEIYNRTQVLGVVFSPASQMLWLVIGMGLGCLLILGILLLTWTRHQEKLARVAARFIQKLPQKRSVILVGLVILSLIFSISTLFSWGEVFELHSLQLLLAGWLVVFATLLFRRVFPDWNWLNLLALALLMISSSYRLFQFIPDVSLMPFSLSWSETSRYYYASLFFSKKIYGLHVSPSTLHPSRYLMQSVPFLIEGLPLWFHRAWQVILWLAGFIGTALLLIRRLKITRKAWWLILSAWVFLFLWQGPVYYHLLVMVMIVLGGFDRQHPRRTLFIVVLASTWAGISRLNWFPVPGMLAALLYFLEQPKGQQPLWKYLAPPLLWTGIGFGIAFASQSLYIAWSGNNPEQFTSSFSSALLWYRLLPNSTYPLGVLTGTILISLPIFSLIAFRLRTQGIRLSPISLLGIVAVLGVLLVGGLVVSVKIGGGSNLHNLDAYLALLMVLGCYFYFDRMTQTPSPTSIPAGINLFLVFVPFFFALNSSAHIVQYQPSIAADTLHKMQMIIDRFSDQDSEILFIAERHLLTFDDIEGVRLVPEYEKVFLMEMVMAANRTYLEAFEADIRNQRFDLIITDTLFRGYKDRGESWAEENNIWVDSVSIPVLCNYRQEAAFLELGLQILEPFDQPRDCPALNADGQE